MMKETGITTKMGARGRIKLESIATAFEPRHIVVCTHRRFYRHVHEQTYQPGGLQVLTCLNFPFIGLKCPKWIWCERTLIVSSRLTNMKQNGFQAFLNELDESTSRDTEAFKKLGNVLNGFLADDSKTSYTLTNPFLHDLVLMYIFGCAACTLLFYVRITVLLSLSISSELYKGQT